MKTVLPSLTTNSPNDPLVHKTYLMKNIILIEDDATVIVLLSTMLETLGFVVTTYTTKASFEIAFKQGLPEEAIIILDGNLDNESTKEFLPAFTDAMKQRTIIHSGDDQFILAAKFYDFVHFAKKHDKTAIKLELEAIVHPLAA
jgi:DNA-binding NtrC family response regulator